MPHGLYVHVPFCVRKCPYCAFFSLPLNPNGVHAWLEGLRQEKVRRPDGFSPVTAYIGGGTPTALEDEPFAHLIELVSSCGQPGPFPFDEWTCEVNPGTLTPSKMKRLRDAGVNRLSIGAQSFHPDTLQRLGRIHEAGDIHRCVDLAREAGLDNLAMDILYGVPDVPFDRVAADIEILLSCQPDHVSCYALEIENGTPFARDAKAGRLALSEDEQRTQFDWIRGRLAAAGLVHYELSNFARPGRECRHNRLYWTGGEYLGWGPASHSHWKGERWGNSPDLPAWTREFSERLDPAAKARETLVMGLRLLKGWNREDFRLATGMDYSDLCGTEIDALTAEGWLVAKPDSIRLDEDVLFISDAVFARLV